MKQLIHRMRSGSIPLNRDATGRFLPFILAILVLLACLMLVGASSLQMGLAGWRGGLEGRATVQIVPKKAIKETVAARQEKVLAILAASDVVEKARIVPDEAVADLLEPWLAVPDGRGEASSTSFLDSLPIPVLVDVTLKEGMQGDDLDVLRAKLAGVRGVVFDDHGGWLQDVRHLAAIALWIASLLVVLVLGAAVLIVVLLVRAGMIMHRDVVELLHLVGATDRRIAWQFQRHMTIIALQGAVLGGAGAAVILSLLGQVAAHAGVTFFATLGIGGNVLILAGVPLGFVMLAAVTSGMVVRHLLEDMP